MTDGHIQRKLTASRRSASTATMACSGGNGQVQGFFDTTGPESAPTRTQQDEGTADETPSDSCRQHREHYTVADHARMLLDLARENDGD